MSVLIIKWGVALFRWSLRSKNRGSLLCSLITLKLPGPVLAKNVHIAPLTHTCFNVIPNYWPEMQLITSLYRNTYIIFVNFLYSSRSRVVISGVLKALIKVELSRHVSSHELKPTETQVISKGPEMIDTCRYWKGHFYILLHNNPRNREKKSHSSFSPGKVVSPLKEDCKLVTSSWRFWDHVDWPFVLRDSHTLLVPESSVHSTNVNTSTFALIKAF